MTKHAPTITLSDADEKAWAYVLALTNAGRSADDQLADVDALIDLRFEELTQGAVSTFIQRPEQVDLESKVLAALRTGTDADVQAIATAAKVDVAPIEATPSLVSRAVTAIRTFTGL